MTKKMMIRSTLLYIYIPVVLFLIGWVRPLISIPTIILLFFCGYWTFKNKNFPKRKKISKKTAVQILIPYVLLVSSCIFLGFGRWFLQPGDWFKHNAVLKDLMNYSWPVYYTQREGAMLTYYVGQYLLPAWIGRITGNFRIAEIAMCIWGIIGIAFVYCNLTRIIGADTFKKRMISLFVFVFFCGALPLAQIVLYEIYPSEFIALGSHHWISIRGYLLQYRSATVMMRWVYPQCIVPWLCTELFWEYRQRVDRYVLMLLPVLLYGTFSFFALLFFAIGMVVYDIVFNREGKETLKKMVSWVNILPAITLGVVFFFYFWGNVSGCKPKGLTLSIQQYGVKYFPVYIIFCFFMFGIQWFCIYEHYKKEPLFYLTLLELMIIPFFKMGLYNDFVMCVSIPALFLLQIYIQQILAGRRSDYGNGIRKGILILCLFIGMWYPFCEMAKNIAEKQKGVMGSEGYQTLGDFTDRGDTEITDDLKYNYYSYDLETNIFYRYFARRQKE